MTTPEQIAGPTEAMDLAKTLDELSKAATQGEWGIWREPISSRHDAIAELTEQVSATKSISDALVLLDAGGLCPASTGCGPTSDANAEFITALVNLYRTGKLIVVPDDAVERPTFSILGSRGARIDLRLVEDHGKQAYVNHRQTVTRLAERGGLSWCELHAVLHNRPWQKMDDNTAIEECRAVEVRYLAALKGADHAG